ncbi:MAG: cbb3-type cytochrome oxidase assembly protein CcoS [Pseudomonadota bacterium]
MNALIWLIPAALGLGLFGLFTFLWTVRSGQYDDLQGSAARILIDDEGPIVDEDEGEAETREEDAGL